MSFSAGSPVIAGSEADKKAKEALSLPITRCLLPYTDFKPYIRIFFNESWQRAWDSFIFTNKFHEIQPKIKKSTCTLQSRRRDESVMVRLRIGHSSLTHSYLLRGEPAPQCTTCNTQLTIKHILLLCPLYRQHRITYFINFSTLKDIFNSTSAGQIILFLHATGMYKLL